MKMFNLPNIFTASNLICGIIAILYSLGGRIDLAPLFIFIAALLDFFDGFLARLLNQQGELGKQLDSLADMVSFGLAPGIVCFVIIAVSLHPDFQLYDGDFIGFQQMWHDWYKAFAEYKPYTWIPFISLLIPFFSMFRLAKFNIDTRQSESFIGLPTPANTLFFMTFPLLLANYSSKDGWVFDLILKSIQANVFIPVILVMSVLLVAELPLFALKFKTFSWKENKIRYVFLITCGILIPIIYIWSIPIVVFLYLILSFIQHILRKKRTHEI